jgi:NADH dehydrogenase
MRPRNVCVLGGSGFVGSHLCPALAGTGHHVTVLSRDPERARQLRVLPTVRVARCDVHDAAQLADALAGHDAVVNLVGIARESRRRGGSFRAAHRDLAHKVVAACRETHVDRLLHMSALNADADRGPSRFLRSKGRGERIVREEGGPDLHWTIFRPSVIFGRGDTFLAEMAGLLRSVPLALPLVMPATRLAPVWVGDVVAAMLTALGDDDTAGESYDLCGPEVLTRREIARFVRDELGLRKAVIPLPWLASRALAAVMDFVPGASLSSDAVRSLSVDGTCAGSGFHRLGIQPQSLRGIAPRYLGVEGERTRYPRFRSRAHR